MKYRIGDVVAQRTRNGVERWPPPPSWEWFGVYETGDSTFNRPAAATYSPINSTPGGRRVDGKASQCRYQAPRLIADLMFEIISP
jgi:hypothetical protein